MQRVLIRKYGLLDPLDWAEDCHEQLWLQNKLWNRFVEIDQEANQRYRELFCADPPYADIQRNLDSLQTEIERLLKERAQLRRQTRSRSAGEVTTVQLRDLQTRRIRLLQAQKSRREEIKPLLVSAIRESERKRKEAMKLARHESGLWWGNYNGICRAYQNARSRALKMGATLRFRSFDGSGRFRNQIQHGMSVEDLFGGRHVQVRISPLAEATHDNPSRAERRRTSRTTLAATIFVKDRIRRTMTWPMILHRPFPPAARIKEVVITRSHEGTRFRWSASFVCTIDEPPPVRLSRGRAAGINCGWRRDESGLRVATIRDTDGSSARIRLPEAVITRASYIDELQSSLDTKLNECQQALAGWCHDEDFPDPLNQLALLTFRHRSARTLARLAVAWREYPDFHPDRLEEMERWRREDKRTRDEMAHLRRKMLGMRRQFYQTEAKRLAETYDAIAVGPLDLRWAARRMDEGFRDNILPPPARRARQIAALSELLDWLQKQCQKTGTQLVTIQSAVTALCYACGHAQTVQPDPHMHRCGLCNALWDQDENAARNALGFMLSSKFVHGGISSGEQALPKQLRTRPGYAEPG